MEDVKLNYTGKIQEVTIGTGPKAITIGGENCLSFHKFEGKIPHTPVISFQVYDTDKIDWPDACKEPFRDVISDPVAWAKKCVEEYGAKLLTIQLASTDPNGENRSATDAMKIVEKLVNSLDIPLIFWGVDDTKKDSETLKLIAELCSGKNVALGPVTDKNYKQIGAAAIAYKHVVIASSPIDVNLAKQLNILLLELGVHENQIIMDPTTGALGYGIEYTYSVMERDRIAALLQQDDKLGFPMICNLANEVWKTKEARISEEQFPTMGKTKDRGICLEAITATLLVLAGADILIMRHPESIKLVSELIEELLGENIS
ncbi:MAG: acetyl-CoA decarbonylase/synthase complex subunit delta [Candidatus Omnitrophica bacterium]|nr:acetyl-CoA decarbonylase/synthase complex subunit delta [Candidatus Omnitrophota bacterium]